MIIARQEGELEGEKNLELAAIREKRNDRTHGRMKCQQGEGSESVDEKSDSHTSVNTDEGELLRCLSESVVSACCEPLPAR